MSKPFMCALRGHKLRFLFCWGDYKAVYSSPPDTVHVYCKRCNTVLIAEADPLPAWADMSEETREWYRQNVTPTF